MKVNLNDILTGLQILVALLYIGYAFAWTSLTTYWLLKLIKGRLFTAVGVNVPPEESLKYVFPMWRKNGRFSSSAFWVWIVVPSSLFLVFIIPIFPNASTRAMATSGAFWTAVIGLISGVLLNYYFGKKLSTDGTGMSMWGAVKSRLTNGTNPGSTVPSTGDNLPGRPGNPGVTQEGIQ